jgi:hypothetical protein
MEKAAKTVFNFKDGREDSSITPLFRSPCLRKDFCADLLEWKY